MIVLVICTLVIPLAWNLWVDPLGFLEIIETYNFIVK